VLRRSTLGFIRQSLGSGGTLLDHCAGTVINSDLRHAFRLMAAAPAFATVAILSLALGIRAAVAALDRVGAAYVTTMGIPVRAGRDMSEADRAASHKVCIVNDAFVQRFFGGRQPIGGQVITVEGDDRTAYDVVGVVADAKTQSLRDAVEPRSSSRPNSAIPRPAAARS
jgi:hypothetical protein